ncbi:MAG: hypothetical protein JRG76_13400, partial [Deltaproteobacteria bacterium]|nr:hypothetical protein [Deltaproteobacteria bacterium]
MPATDLDPENVPTRRWSTPLLLAALVASIATSPALAQEREHVFGWIAPPESVDGFTIHLGPTSETYTQQVELDFVPPDPDGVTRAAVILDSSLGYFATVTATNSAGESPHSNELFIGPSVCDPAACDDGDPCTADDCNAAGCTHDTMPDGTLCGAATEICLAGVCQQVECSDGDVCNGEETLGPDGACLPGVAPTCEPATQCADPVCDAVDGCLMLARPDGTSCDDGNPGTISDRCQVGWCVGDPALPDIPDVPEVPEVPEIPEVPDEPEAPEGDELRPLSLDGATQRVEIADSDDWSFAGDFTIELWTKFSNVDGLRPMIGHDEGPGRTNKWIFGLNESGSPRVDFHINSRNGRSSNPISLAFSPSIGVWYHWAITRTGT